MDFSIVGGLRCNTDKIDINFYACFNIVHYSNEIPEKEDSAAENVEEAVI